MKQFNGFPAKMKFTPIPNLFINTLLQQINDIIELKTTLFIFELLYQKRGYPTYITHEELLQNLNLMNNFLGKERPQQVLSETLDAIVRRGIFLRTNLEQEGRSEDIYMLNNTHNRQIAEKIARSEINLRGLKAKKITHIHPNKVPDIFTLYEENIGILTPMIADELREAEELYPEVWIQDAIKEAVSQNKRKWKYISTILEHWSLEGKNNGTDRRHIKTTDPEKYVKGQYGHMVRH